MGWGRVRHWGVGWVEKGGGKRLAVEWLVVEWLRESEAGGEWGVGGQMRVRLDGGGLGLLEPKPIKHAERGWGGLEKNPISNLSFEKKGVGG